MKVSTGTASGQIRSSVTADIRGAGVALAAKGSLRQSATVDPNCAAGRRTKSGSWLIRRAAAAASTIALTSAGLALALPAGAVSANIQTTDAVNVRPGPSTGSGSALAVMPSGTSPSFNCWTQGQNVGGVDVWFNITYGGVTGYYASYYDNSHYASDAEITAKYGIPQCGSAPTTSPAPQSAINWAEGYANARSTQYSGMCLLFVFNAWSNANINLRSQVAVGINGNTYPVDIWGHFSNGQTGGGTPPAGALVFYANRGGDRTLSHVTLSVGGGNTVSTSDGVASGIHYETISQHSYANYLGWWLPAS